MRMMIATLALLAACAPAMNAGGRPLEGTDWTLVELAGAPVPAGVRAPTLRLDSGRATGNGGCNSMFGAYERSGASLAFEGIGSTRMACMEPAGIMERETAYFEALGRTATFSVSGDTLTLSAADGPLMRLVAR